MIFPAAESRDTIPTIASGSMTSCTQRGTDHGVDGRAWLGVEHLVELLRLGSLLALALGVRLLALVLHASSMSPPPYGPRPLPSEA
jgi:hypothetical protein